MKKTKKLTVLFLTGSLALCAMPTHTNAGFLSRFFGSKYGGIAIASTLVSVAALTKFYVKDEGIESGFFTHTPFYLKALGNTIIHAAKGEEYMAVGPIASMLLGRNVTKKIKKSTIGKIFIMGLSFLGWLFFSPEEKAEEPEVNQDQEESTVPA